MPAPWEVKKNIENGILIFAQTVLKYLKVKKSGEFLSDDKNKSGSALEFIP